MIKAGMMYKTFGGWDAKVIWNNKKGDDEEFSYIVVHKPETDEETVALCDENGVAQSMFAINEPPTYDVHHPADLMIED